MRWWNCQARSSSDPREHLPTYQGSSLYLLSSPGSQAVSLESPCCSWAQAVFPKCSAPALGLPHVGTHARSGRLGRGSLAPAALLGRAGKGEQVDGQKCRSKGRPRAPQPVPKPCRQAPGSWSQTRVPLENPKAKAAHSMGPPSSHSHSTPSPILALPPAPVPTGLGCWGCP